MSRFPAALNASNKDIQELLAAQVHIGGKNLREQFRPYVYKRRDDGIYIINLEKTFEKLTLAARAIVAIENPQDVCIVASRPYGIRAALKFAQFTGAQAITERYTPGTFTNYITPTFREPRLVIVVDANADHQAVTESSFVNVPVVALCDVDSPFNFIDIAIPCNNRAKYSIGTMIWMLTREVLRMRGTISRDQPWNVMVDLFFYRDPVEAEKENEALQAARKNAAETAALESADAVNWDQPTGEWGPAAGDWGMAETGGVPVPPGEWSSASWDQQTAV